MSARRQFESQARDAGRPVAEVDEALAVGRNRLAIVGALLSLAFLIVGARLIDVVVIKEHAMESDRRKCLAAGCDDYATKPIDRRKLIEMIQQHLPNEAAVAELQGSERRHG